MTKILNKKISCFCNYRKKNTQLKFEYKKNQIMRHYLI